MIAVVCIILFVTWADRDLLQSPDFVKSITQDTALVVRVRAVEDAEIVARCLSQPPSTPLRLSQISVALRRGGEAPVTIWSRLHLVPERIGTFWVLDAAIDEASLCLLTVEGTSIAFQVVDFVQGSAERRKSVVGWQRDAGARILTRESVAGQISGKLRDRSLRIRIVAFRGGSRPSYTTEFRLAADGESLERVVPGAATSRPDDTN